MVERKADTITVRDRNLARLSEVLAVLPPGAWTTAGDLGAFLGVRPQEVGRYVRDTRFVDRGAHRVLDSDGRGRIEGAMRLLREDGVAVDDRGRADPARRIDATGLKDLALGITPAGVLSDQLATVTSDSPWWQPGRTSPQDVDAMERALAASDVQQYGSNGRLLFAAQLLLDLDDIHDVAAEALTDGPDDKSCDFLYIDRDSGILVIAQGAERQTAAGGVKAKKAADLNAAIAWVLSGDLATSPAFLRARFAEARAAVRDGSIRDVRAWLVHNRNETADIARELDTAGKSLALHLSSLSPPQEISSSVQQVGLVTLAELHRSSSTPIGIDDDFDIPVSGALLEETRDWSSYLVSIPLTWLQNVAWHHDYGPELFSANIRGPLGPRRSVNQGIRDTLKNEPENFFIYNNGITAAVRDMQFDQSTSRLHISGLSIVNGAQTVGALKDIGLHALQSATVMARFIRCPDRHIMERVVRYNNRQNSTEAADFRSNDRHQTRLVEEFRRLQVRGYTGGRRDAKSTGAARDDVETLTAARALTCFHGEPGIAYQAPRLIWADDVRYERLFSRASARHILFCWSLRRAVDRFAQTLQEIDGRPNAKQKQYELLQTPGALSLFVTAVAACCEDLLDRKILDLFDLVFPGQITPAAAIEIWEPMVRKLVPTAVHELPDLLEGGLSRTTGIGSLEDWQSRVAARVEEWTETLDPFRRAVGS